MQLKVFVVLLSALLLSSCAKQYMYRFPSENERKQYKVEDLRWSYKGTVPDTITVTDGDRLYRLPVTDKTKLEVYTTYNEKYKFYLQSIAITGEGEFLGSNQMWRGYDLLSHTDRTVAMREIANVVVVSDIPAEATIK
jgi:hypothetical protein